VHAQTSTPSADALTSACRILFTIHRSVTMDSGDVDVETVAELIQRLRSKHLNWPAQEFSSTAWMRPKRLAES
jgi:hypothetical protein